MVAFTKDSSSITRSKAKACIAGQMGESTKETDTSPKCTGRGRFVEQMAGRM